MKNLLAVVGTAILLIFAFGSDSSNSSSGGASGSVSTRATGAKPTAQAAPPKREPSYTVSQNNAIRSAKTYLRMKGFSKAGLIKQLTSSYGDGFPKDDAVFAVNHIDVDWNEQACRAARSYLQMKGFSHAGLVRQLESDYGDGFTHAQAEYAAKKAGL